MSRETIARVDAFAKTISTSWSPARRSDAVRVLIEMALAEIDRSGIEILPDVEHAARGSVRVRARVKRVNRSGR